MAGGQALVPDDYRDRRGHGWFANHPRGFGWSRAPQYRRGTGFSFNLNTLFPHPDVDQWIGRRTRVAWVSPTALAVPFFWRKTNLDIGIDLGFLALSNNDLRHPSTTCRGAIFCQYIDRHYCAGWANNDLTWHYLSVCVAIQSYPKRVYRNIISRLEQYVCRNPLWRDPTQTGRLHAVDQPRQRKRRRHGNLCGSQPRSEAEKRIKLG